MNERLQIERELVRLYREIRRLERRLKAKGINRQFRNQQCKTALKQLEARGELQQQIGDTAAALATVFRSLPEVQVEDTKLAWPYAQKLASRPRRKRYLRNQTDFLEKAT